MRRLDVVVLALGAVTALLVGTDVVPGLRGPDTWRWQRRALESYGSLWVSVAVFVATVGVALRARSVWGVARLGMRAVLLAVAVGLVVLQMLVLTAAEPGGLTNVTRRVLDPSFTSYHTVARNVEDPGEFLRRYHRIQRTFPVHGPSQPPGRILFFRAINEWASAPGRTESLLAFGHRVGGVPVGPPGTTDGQRAGALAAGFALLGLGALSLVPLVVVVGGRSEPEAVGAALLLMSCVPSFVLFTPQTDHLILLLATSAAAFGLAAIRRPERGGAPLLALGAGLCGSLGIFVSFTSLAALGAWGLALVGLLVFARRRDDASLSPARFATLTVAALVGLAAVPAATTAVGMNWPAVFREATAAAHHVQVVVFKRQFSTWVVQNLVDFVVFLGPPLALAWFARLGPEARGALDGRRPEAPFGIALLAALLALDASGRILGETGRIWMFLMPLAVASVALGSRGRPAREVVSLAGAQLVVLLALRAFWNVPG